jgi:hypothetical protein
VAPAPPILVYLFSFWQGSLPAFFLTPTGQWSYNSGLFCIWIQPPADQRDRASLLTFTTKIIDMLTVILLLAGFACFALFFKSIDFFDKI